jgi:hypothetical protein
MSETEHNTEEENKQAETIKNSDKIAIRNEKGQLLPGAILNPHGRPRKGNAITDCMREYLDGIIDVQDGKTRKQAFVRAVYACAMKGNTSAEGKPTQKLELENFTDFIIKTEDASEIEKGNGV